MSDLIPRLNKKVIITPNYTRLTVPDLERLKALRDCYDGPARAIYDKEKQNEPSEVSKMQR